MEINFDEEKFKKTWIVKVKKELKIAKNKHNLILIDILEKELKRYTE